MKPHPLLRKTSAKDSAGFALVASITIMAVLVMIGVALYSLSSVATKSAEIASARTEAQANAKLALMQAIGKLQGELGPDQRISANAAILDKDATTSTIDTISHPHWTGVWESWKAGGSTSSAHSTIQGVSDGDMHPSYEAGREPYFRSWLISIDETDTNMLSSSSDAGLARNPSVTPTLVNDAVTLVGEGSLGLNRPSGDSTAAEQVHVPLVDIKSTDGQNTSSGRFGWWVGDESQKARLMADAYNNTSSTPTTAEKIYRQYAPGSPAIELFSGLENVDDSNLERLPDFGSLDLLDNVSGDPLPSKVNFHHATTRSLGILTDVREGGLKRDLNTLLEQPIDLNDTATIDKHILYEFDDPRFNDREHSRVPIQDLSAFYQLYKNITSSSNEPHQGIEFSSNAIEVIAPDFGDNPGDSTDKEKFLREYTTLYRNPIPIRVQFVIGVFAKEITPFERQYGGWTRVDTDADGKPDTWKIVERDPPIRGTQTHKLVTSITPVLTMWNPNNVSMTLTRGEAYSQVMKMTSPSFYLEWTKYRSDVGDTITTNAVNMMYMATGHTSANNYSEIASMSLSDTTKVTFEPGEVKIFSIPTNGVALINQDIYESGSHGQGIQSAEAGWDPSGLMPMTHSATGNASVDVYTFLTSDQESDRNNTRSLMTFGSNDAITFGIYPEDTSGQQNVSRHAKVAGSAFNFWMMSHRYTRWRSSNTGEHLINYMFTTRAAGDIKPGGNRVEINITENIPFNRDLILLGFPDGQEIEPESISESISGGNIISGSDPAINETITLFQFTMTAASEVNGDQMGFNNAGRKRPTRPFLHGSSIAPPFVDNLDPSSLYTYGWEWQVEKINSMASAPIQHNGEKSYFGGGYTAEYGNAHVVQREIPTVPPISIGSLSHTHLGGFSLGDETPVEFNNSQGRGGKRLLRDITRSQGYQRVTAHGFAGLAPHTLQAIGNSYAHPKVPAERAFTTWNRYFDYDDYQPTQMEHTDTQPDSWGGEHAVPCVDHAYLANKALWDEYFFSSIAPQPPASDNPLFDGAGKTAEQVAEDFFLNDQPLPNRRYVPYKSGLTEQTITDLFTGELLREDGPIDAISSHMMVKGPFNINSTSVEAWKVFLSSHREETIQYYEGNSSLPSELNTTNTPFGYGGMANLNTLVSTSGTNDAKNEEQWRTWRSISDEEIEQLAQAIVHQVKLRGPFLSLSEFVNRRLEPHNAGTKLSLKGALQTALDFEGDGDVPEVTINREFRTAARSLDDEIDSNLQDDAAYPEALEGPVAYGSAPYVDQADILRGFAGQLTPRGDTFVIRAYGDRLDASGEVIARAWCEAVVQRTPEYLKTEDQNHTAFDDLTSETNRRFGRKFNIVSFRWLNEDEV